MTYAFTQDVPIDAAFYQRIVEGLGDAPPKGLITHIALERPEGGLRYIDLWVGLIGLRDVLCVMGDGAGNNNTFR